MHTALCPLPCYSLSKKKNHTQAFDYSKLSKIYILEICYYIHKTFILALKRSNNLNFNAGIMTAWASSPTYRAIEMFLA